MKRLLCANGHEIETPEDYNLRDGCTAGTQDLAEVMHEVLGFAGIQCRCGADLIPVPIGWARVGSCDVWRHGAVENLPHRETIGCHNWKPIPLVKR